MKCVPIHVAKTQLSALVERVAAGEEIIIAQAGMPMARLVPLDNARRDRKLGSTKIRIADDFDAPLPDEIGAAFGAGE